MRCCSRRAGGLSTLFPLPLKPDCASHRHFHAPQQRFFAWMAQALAPVFSAFSASRRSLRP